MHWKAVDTVMQNVKEASEAACATNATDATNANEAERDGPSNRRREPRVALTFPIEVSGFERLGKYFVERTSCSDVGEISCAFTLRTAVALESVVAIRSFHWQNSSVMESRPVLFQVARVEEGEEHFVVAGVRLYPQP